MRVLPFLKSACLLCILFFTDSVALYAQDTLPYIDVSKVKYSKSIASNIATCFVPVDKKLSTIPVSDFMNGTIYKNAIPPSLVAKKAVIKFNLSNSGDSIQTIYFFPGFYYPHYALYYFHEGSVIPINQKLPLHRDSIGYRSLEIPPHDSVSLIAELFLEKTYINSLKPRIINADFLGTFIADRQNTASELNIMTYIFCGLFLMMILFSMTSYLMNASSEFLYYSGYAFFLGFMLFTKTIFNGQINRVALFLESYLDFIMQSLGVLFYMLFMKVFLDTKKHFPFLDRLYNTGISLLILAMITFSYCHFFLVEYVPEYYIEMTTKFLLLAMIIVFIVYGLLNWNKKILRFLVWGNLALFIFSLISQLIITLNIKFPNSAIIFNSSLFYYECGLFAELFLFLLGLNYKNRLQLIRQTRERERLKSENQLKEAEKKLAVYKAQQEERNRISLDMHDELGSGITAIRLMSEIAKKKMTGAVPKEIDRISYSANDLLNKMNAIIWSMNSRNDTVDNLVSYIRTYAFEYFENTAIIVKVNSAEEIPCNELTGDKRRNIFLCVKETLNNLVKHSQATVAEISITCVDEKLEIKIHDNGIGIDLQNIRQCSNGLQNIARRMATIGGSFHIENNKGTVTILTLPLNA
jgi:signal transduction histidine kinase